MVLRHILPISSAVFVAVVKGSMMHHTRHFSQFVCLSHVSVPHRLNLRTKGIEKLKFV